MAQPIGVNINFWPPIRHSRKKKYIPAPLLIAQNSKHGSREVAPSLTPPPPSSLPLVPFTLRGTAAHRCLPSSRHSAHQLLSGRQAGATNDLRFSLHPSALCTSRHIYILKEKLAFMVCATSTIYTLPMKYQNPRVKFSKEETYKHASID